MTNALATVGAAGQTKTATEVATDLRQLVTAYFEYFTIEDAGCMVSFKVRDENRWNGQRNVVINL
jgi:hypothetical protein